MCEKLVHEKQGSEKCVIPSCEAETCRGGQHGQAGENSGSLSEERGVEVHMDGGGGWGEKGFPSHRCSPLSSPKCKNPPWLSVHHFPAFSWGKPC